MSIEVTQGYADDIGYIPASEVLRNSRLLENALLSGIAGRDTNPNQMRDELGATLIGYVDTVGRKPAYYADAENSDVASFDGALIIQAEHRAEHGNTAPVSIHQAGVPCRASGCNA